MVAPTDIAACLNVALSVLALSSRFDGQSLLLSLHDLHVSFSTRSVESF